MGSDKNYLGVTLADGADTERVRQRLLDGDTFDRADEYGEWTVVVGRGSDTESAVDELRAVGDAVERGLVLHVYDTTMTGVGTYYEIEDGDPVEIDACEGAERYGVDVVDYFKREYGVDGLR